jgi:ribosome recycling factor
MPAAVGFEIPVPPPPAVKNKQLTQDAKAQAEEKVQAIINLFIKKIDDIVANKEKEIMEV